MNQSRDILLYVRGDDDLAHQMAQGHDFSWGRALFKDGLDLGQFGRRGRADDALDFLMGRVAQADLEEKAVQLGFRQRVGALHLNRVEGGQDKKGRRQTVGGAGHRHLQFGHGFEQGGLGFGGGAVDLVGQQHVREDRPRHKAEIAPAVLAVHDHAGAGNVGRHEVNRKLNPAEAEVQRLGQRADDQRLARSRHALDQDVATGKKGDQDVLDQLVVADHDPGHF